MELGIGFCIGILGGGVVAAIVAVIVAASRRAMRRKQIDQTRIMGVNELADAIQVSRETRRALPQRRKTDHVAKDSPAATRVISPAESVRLSSGNTMIIERMDERENLLHANIQEVRDLLLRLAGVVSATESASGETAVAFKSAKDTIDKFDFDDSSDLANAQSVLIREIDRVVSSNAKLHAELDKANQGIAEQRRQIEELRVQARIDALTRIPNRASFDERLSEYIDLLARTNLIFTLMLLDIDHFKGINDSHGHVNGDRILRGIAAKISDSVRNNDFAARYGGEEFAVILPGTGEQESLIVAERVRQDIANTKFRLDGEIVKVSISGGLAECKKGMTTDQIIAAADAALYRAKSAGRNQILSSEGSDSRGVKRL